MNPEPISPLAINVILQYILPPSQLSQTLPTHLTSISLLKRHHFMNISPNDPLEYLCWPSENRARAFELLEEFSTHRINEDDAQERDVRYTSDIEYTYAHVRLEEDLRIVFQWDEGGEDGWKYHDTNVMPFPPGSLPSLQDVLTEASAKTFGDSSPLQQPSYGNLFGVIEEEASDDDSYWNAYGAHDDGETPIIHEPKPVAANGEDAYWAQYASVQGSGDSTVPSPSPTGHRRMTIPSHLREQQPTPPTPPDFDDELPLPIAIRGHDQRSNLAPPSPKTLTRRLKAISPRVSPASTRPSSRGPVTPIEPSPLSFEDKFDEVTEDGSCTVVISPKSPPEVSGQTPPQLGVKGVNGVNGVNGVDDDLALRESIRSVWRLWKMSRRTDGEEDDREVFLRVAKEVLEMP